jgi:hypothetical protein
MIARAMTIQFWKVAPKSVNCFKSKSPNRSFRNQDELQGYFFPGAKSKSRWSGIKTSWSWQQPRGRANAGAADQAFRTGCKLSALPLEAGRMIGDLRGLFRVKERTRLRGSALRAGRSSWQRRRVQLR